MKITYSKIILFSLLAMISFSCKKSTTTKTKKAYQSEVLLKLFSLKTANDLYIQIPQTKKKCKITTLIDHDSIHYAKGTYQNGEEKGSIFIDYLKILALNTTSTSPYLMVIPFTVSNQGSGVFKYIGLFELNYKTKAIKQLDSYFLGDRIKISSIKYNGIKTIQIKLKKHSKSQNMAETPLELKTLKINIDNKRFHLTDLSILQTY